MNLDPIGKYVVASLFEHHRISVNYRLVNDWLEFRFAEPPESLNGRVVTVEPDGTTWSLLEWGNGLTNAPTWMCQSMFETDEDATGEVSEWIKDFFRMLKGR